jgi:divalent metal cation (Fe/Co/Zn/Cd) transporter
MDAGVSEQTLTTLHRSLQPLISSSLDGTSFPSTTDLLHVTELRAKRSGTKMLVDLSAHVPSQISVARASELEEHIKAALIAKRSEVGEVRVRFVPIDIGSPK